MSLDEALSAPVVVAETPTPTEISRTSEGLSAGYDRDDDLPDHNPWDNDILTADSLDPEPDAAPDRLEAAVTKPERLTADVATPHGDSPVEVDSVDAVPEGVSKPTEALPAGFHVESDTEALAEERVEESAADEAEVQ